MNIWPLDGDSYGIWTFECIMFHLHTESESESLCTCTISILQIFYDTKVTRKKGQHKNKYSLGIVYHLKSTVRVHYRPPAL